MHYSLSLDKSTDDSGELRESDEENEERRCMEQKDQKPEGQTSPIPEKVCVYLGILPVAH